MVRVIPISVRKRHFRWRLAVAMTLLFWLLASFLLPGDQSGVRQPQHLSKRLSNRGLNEEGAVEWELFGQRATVKGANKEKNRAFRFPAVQKA